MWQIIKAGPCRVLIKIIQNRRCNDLGNLSIYGICCICVLITLWLRSELQILCSCCLFLWVLHSVIVVRNHRNRAGMVVRRSPSRSPFTEQGQLCCVSPILQCPSNEDHTPFPENLNLTNSVPQVQSTMSCCVQEGSGKDTPLFSLFLLFTSENYWHVFHGLL